MIATLSLIFGMLLIGLYARRRYNFVQKERRGETQFGEYVRFHFSKYLYLFLAACLLGVASAGDDLTEESFISGATTFIVGFALFDLFTTKRRKA